MKIEAVAPGFHCEASVIPNFIEIRADYAYLCRAMGIINFCCNKVCKPITKRLLSPPPVVAVIPLQGVIGSMGKLRGEGLNAESLEAPIKKAFEISRLQAVVLEINSPGGSPVQSALIYNLIRYHAAKKDVPVLAFIEDVGASGGYWLACAGDEVFAMEASIVGSIGVVAAGFGFQQFIEKHGIERRVYTQGKSKSMLDPFLPEKPEDVKQLKAAQADVFASFKNLVKERRGDKLTAKPTEIFTGAIWSGVKAKKLGLVDELGDMRSVCRERFGDEIEFKSFKASKGFVSKKLGMLSPQAWADTIVDTASERLLWMRYGL